MNGKPATWWVVGLIGATMVTSPAHTAAALEISAITVFACSEQGVVNDALRFNAGPIDGAWDVCLYEGDVFDPKTDDPKKIKWLNDKDSHTIHIPLTKGTHTFTYHHDSPGQAPVFAMNMFFDGKNNQAGVSVLAHVNQAQGRFAVNRADHTQGWPITAIPAAGKDHYGTVKGTLWHPVLVDKEFTVTLKEFRVWSPSEKELDLVGPTSFGPDGKHEYVGQFTLVVEECVPRPMDAILWLRAVAGITIGQADYGEQWKQQFDYQQATPFSFLYGDSSSVEFFERCETIHQSKRLDKNRDSHTVKYRDPKTGLELRWEGIAYRDFPTVEWTLYFKNTGNENTPILSEIQPLKTILRRGNEGEYLLHSHVGDTCSATSFQPIARRMSPNDEYVAAPAGGRPTSMGFPYFNLECEGEGLIAVISWPGQWKAGFHRDSGNELQIVAGQELTHLTLYPGEEIRTPRVVLQFWKDGDWIDAQNVWRRWMMAHNMPHPGGKLIQPMNLGSSYRVHHEMTGANEKNLIPFMSRFLEEKLRIDCWWMDAGWYPCKGNWAMTGSWWPDPERFPNGLKPICDFAHKNGMKTMVWFEPERVHAGTWLANEHPEWVHGGAAGGLLKLHQPEVRKWLTEHVDKVMTDNGIDNYRQDFNIEPLAYWRANDAEDRRGITEIRHVTNYLAHFAELARRHPDMFLDTCASGGRRLSLDTLRYAVPLWRSDYQYVSDHVQGLTYGLSFWIPYYGGGNVACEAGYYGEGTTPVQPYAFWSCCYPAINCAIDVRAEDIDYDALRDLFQKRDIVVKYFCGDYYPLTAYSQESSVWIAWQFDRPDLGEGVVQAFRHKDSPFFGRELRLRGLLADATYELAEFDNPEKARVTGRQLMDQGLPITIKGKPGAAVIVYRRAE